VVDSGRGGGASTGPWFIVFLLAVSLVASSTRRKH
jgi:hypothetical protein